MSVESFDAAQDVLDRADALLALDVVSESNSVREDLRRMALALGVAALDTYFHWAIRRTSFAAMTPKLADITVPFGELISMCEKSVKARNRGVADRPQTRARNVLNNQLLKRTFQTARQVEDALLMVGVTKCWTKLSEVISPPATAREITQRLNDLSYRRNKIVHEGDLRRQVRPRKVCHESIRREDVENDLKWIRSFVDALAILVP